MRASKWFSCPVLLAWFFVAFFENGAVAQKSNPQSGQAEVQATDHGGLARTVANDHPVPAQPKPKVDESSTKTTSIVPVQPTTDQPASDQPASKTGADAHGVQGSIPNADQGGESGEEELDTPKPRVALPVILSPDSPDLDRTVKREDIPSVPDDYVIGEEDVLTITVWKEHDLSGSLVVRPDGKITVPLVGEIGVVGMKPVQLQALLAEKLKPFVNVPQVSVAVNQINSRKVYLIGQVVREGTVPINNSATVLQVLAGAGGLRDFAKRKKIYILRKQGDEEIRFPFDYDAAIKGRNREQNIRLEPGDTVVVP